MITQRADLISRICARAFFAIILSFAILIPTVEATQAAAMENLRKYAGIVVDAKSGKVLYEEAADAKRYPASVSKVMTLYILFQELQAGNIKLSTKMPVSKHAAAAVPTKLGLKAGSTITVENAIKAIVTLSANDMARVIAEYISGDEAKFAQRMTATARALGMARTTYRNASGLPDPGQITTVRDQAILGVAVFQHFPKYYEYFQTRSFSYGSRTYGNHNRLLGENGIDGIKTGYINAAGSNLLTAARKDGRHLIVVAFGFNSSNARDAKVRELVRTYLPKSRQGDFVRTAMVPLPGRQGSAPVQFASTQIPVAVKPMPLPSFRVASLGAAPSTEMAAYAAPANQNVDQQVTAALKPPTPATPSSVELEPAVRAANVLAAPPPAPAIDPSRDVIGQWITETLGAPPAPLGQTAPSAPLSGNGSAAIDMITSNAVGDMPVAVAQQKVPALTDPATGWIVQIGATPTEDAANALINDAATRVGVLANARSFVERFEKNGQTFYRARFGGFDGRDAAAGACDALKKQNLSCLAMQS